MSDKIFMQKALELAARARGKTSPNPMVGAVIVKDGKVVAADYHRKAGTHHAEVLALKKAGNGARNATLYVNLEPCCHTEKRTPPCTRAIISSGIKNVVVAMTDPNPLVSGQGMKELRRAGVQTKLGVLREEAGRLNEIFTKFITKKEPFVMLKMAQSLDGKIATSKGDSKWITGPEARGEVHRLRNEIDALLVGIGTVNKDNPSLDCRIKGGRNPYRVIVDSSLRISLNAKVLKHADGKTIIATTMNAPQQKVSRLRSRGITVLPLKGHAGSTNRSRVNLKKLMKELGKRELTSVMIEGGSSIAASALASGIVDKVLFFIAPTIIGGIDSIPSIGGGSPATLRKAMKLRNIETRIFGRDILVEGYV
jgi:diaminohydroxyphosphoribosylaminopyrimidine deaminase/5-amino-6-(5-phosphoribosylamino)uracil reductase